MNIIKYLLDIDGMFLVASTNWYKKFFNEKDIAI